MRLIAHRGGRGFGTDNTLAAMEKAVRAGVRTIETDVRRTEDDRLVICHDSTLWGRTVRKTTYEEFARHAPDRPLLSEVLERLAGWVDFDIEIKEASALDVARMLESYGILEDTIVTSFDKDIIQEYKIAFPSAATGLLYRMPYGWERKIERACMMGAGILAPYFNSISQELVTRAHERGLQVYAWTVNDDDDFRKLASWGVDAIITDRYLHFR